MILPTNVVMYANKKNFELHFDRIKGGPAGKPLILATLQTFHSNDRKLNYH